MELVPSVRENLNLDQSLSYRWWMADIVLDDWVTSHPIVKDS